MTSEDHNRLAQELNTMIHDTMALLDRFEESGMDLTMADDYEELQMLLAKATKEYRMHLHAGLGR
jgi:hypothetical protein